jgi:hypothetical protein
MNQTKVIDLLNKDYIISTASLESWKDAHGADWKEAINAEIVQHLEMCARRNARWGTHGKIIVPKLYQPFFKGSPDLEIYLELE